MWPFKRKPTVTIKEAYNKLLPIKYKGYVVYSIEHHGKGYSPQGLDYNPDCFRILFKKDGRANGVMLSEDKKVELIENSFAKISTVQMYNV